MSFGIFLGYRMAPGGRWGGQYIVCDLSDFVNRPLHVDAAGSAHRIWPHYTEQVFMTKDMVFPLKPKYERLMRTLGGQESLLGDHQIVHTDEYGKLTVTNGYNRDEYEAAVTAAEMTPECR